MSLLSSDKIYGDLIVTAPIASSFVLIKIILIWLGADIYKQRSLQFVYFRLYWLILITTLDVAIAPSSVTDLDIRNFEFTLQPIKLRKWREF